MEQSGVEEVGDEDEADEAGVFCDLCGFVLKSSRGLNMHKLLKHSKAGPSKKKRFRQKT